MKTYYYLLLLCYYIDYMYVLNRYNLTNSIIYIHTNKNNNHTNTNWGAY